MSTIAGQVEQLEKENAQLKISLDQLAKQYKECFIEKIAHENIAEAHSFYEEAFEKEFRRLKQLSFEKGI